MPLYYVGNLARKSFETVSTATLKSGTAIYQGAKLSANFTAQAAGKGIKGTLDGLEYVDGKLVELDESAESTLGKAGRAAGSVFGEEAAHHGERAGRLSYRGGKFAMNFLPFPPVLSKTSQALRHLKR